MVLMLRWTSSALLWKLMRVGKKEIIKLLRLYSRNNGEIDINLWRDINLCSIIYKERDCCCLLLYFEDFKVVSD